ncbi:hypothetical protein ABZX93_30555 [Streptomyces sp. NPDC006632]|uniref:hypothetical protein n=1 Tax=unclassified Streptomyces TaxID=2593676 RepID=UPI002E1CADB7
MRKLVVSKAPMAIVPIAALSGLLLAGCGTAEHTGASRVNSAQEPGSDAAGGAAHAVAAHAAQGAAGEKAGSAFELPLTDYRPTGAEYTRINQARSELARQCMEGLGFKKFQPAPVQSLGPGANGVDAMEDLDDLRYGTHDAEQAGTYGYKPEFVVKRTNGFVAPPAAPKRSPEEWLALTGTKEERSDAVQNGLTAPKLQNGTTVPYGGCLNEGLKKVTDGKPVIADLVTRLDGQSYKASLEDSGVKKVFAAWSSCMKGKGYSYSDPMKANDDPKFAQSSITEAEKATATADVACKSNVDLIGVWNSAEVKIQTRLIQEHRQELAQIKQDKAAALKVADSVLRG